MVSLGYNGLNKYQSDMWYMIPQWHDDVIKWKHFPHYWPFMRGIHRSPVNSSHKGQWRGALMFSLICAWINGWVNNREAGDLRRHRAHYDITVMNGLNKYQSDTWYMTPPPPLPNGLMRLSQPNHSSIEGFNKESFFIEFNETSCARTLAGEIYLQLFHCWYGSYGYIKIFRVGKIHIT